MGDRQYKTTALVSATGYYHIFAIPYIASYSFFNKDTRFEIFVDDVEEFNYKYSGGISKLTEIHGDGIITVRQIDVSALGSEFQQATPRFVQIPTVKTDYVYIGDVDILILDSMISDQHIHNMLANDLPFSNVLRNDAGNAHFEIGPRLTGLHFSEWGAYYPLPETLTKQNEISSEHLLYEIVRDKLGDFEISTDFRPMHGFHISDKLHTWDPNSTEQIGLHTDYLTGYFSLRGSEYWNILRPLFSEIYLSWLDIIDSTIDMVWPENNGISVPRPNYRDGKITGPGMSDCPKVSDITACRHQFLDVPSQKKEFTEAGQIFDFIDYIKRNDLRKLVLIGGDYVEHFSTINRVFSGMTILKTPGDRYPPNGLYDVLEQRGVIESISWDDASFEAGSLVVISPQAYDYMAKVDFDWSAIGSDVGIGIITSDSDHDFCETGECLTNTRILTNLDREDSFCIQRKFEDGHEIRYYVDVYPMGVSPVPDKDGASIINEIQKIEIDGDDELFAEFYESNKYRLDYDKKRVDRYVRYLYSSELYEECISEVDRNRDKNPALLKMRARAMRNSGDLENCINFYRMHLMNYPDDTDCLIEMVEAIKNMGADFTPDLNRYSEMTRNRKQLDEWLSKNGVLHK